MVTMTRRRMLALTAAGGTATALLSVGSTQAFAADNNQIAWDFLRKLGFTQAQTAGFIGNWIVESGQDPIDPAAVQYQGGGRGIAQWDGSRRTELFNYADRRGLPWQNLQLQLDFVELELTGPERKANDEVRKTTTPRDAAVAVRVYYERPGIPHEDRRISAAESIYQRYSDGTAPPPPNSGFPVLSLGSKGTAVRSMQYFLRHLGYSVALDSSFDTTSEEVLRKFQADRRLKADGYCGPITWEALVVIVKPGFKGQAVLGAQHELNDAGYELAYDSSFGPAMERAVRDYQTKNRLEVDGSCGPITWAALID